MGVVCFSGIQSLCTPRRVPPMGFQGETRGGMRGETLGTKRSASASASDASSPSPGFRSPQAKKARSEDVDNKVMEETFARARCCCLVV